MLAHLIKGLCQWSASGLAEGCIAGRLSSLLTMVPLRPVCSCVCVLAAVQLRAQLSPALSAAAAICGHVHDWLLGTPPGDYVSMGVSSDGSYGIATGLVYSFPVQCNRGSWSIVKGRNWGPRGSGS